MRALVLGATGMLGYACCLEFVRHGHEVEGVSRSGKPLGAEFNEHVVVHAHDMSSVSDIELTSLMLGTDVLVYALGPDDREVPAAPALDYYREHLVARTARILQVARQAGVRRAVVLGSYFSYFDRQHPEWKLAEHHPYIQARQEQAQAAIAAGEPEEEGEHRLDVMILEIPYVFGATPGQTPFWKDVLFDRLRAMKRVLYPAGGSAMVTTKQVGEAVVGLALRGEHGGRYPVADVNMSWNELIAIVRSEMGLSTGVTNVPAFLTALPLRRRHKELREKGLEAGLDYSRLPHDIMHRKLYVNTEESRRQLAFTSGGVPQAIRETVWASYPEDE